MKTSMLLVSALLLGFLASVHPSNPDSEIVQGKCESGDLETPAGADRPPESEDKDNFQKSDPVLKADSQAFPESDVYVKVPSQSEGNVQKSDSVPNAVSQAVAESEVYVEVPNGVVDSVKVQKSAPMRMADDESDSEMLRDEGNVQNSETSRQTKSLGIIKEVPNQETTLQRSAPMRKDESQVGSSILVSGRSAGVPIIRVIMPIRTSSGTVLRQVAVYEKLDSGSDRSSVWRGLSNNQQSSGSLSVGRRQTTAEYVNQGARNPNNSPSGAQNPGGVQIDYRGSPRVPERQSDAYNPPNIAGTPFSGGGVSSQGMRPSVGQNPNNLPSRRQNPGGVQTDYRGNPGVPSDSYVPPSIAGTSFSGSASSQGMRPSAGQNPSSLPSRRQNPGGAQTDYRGNPGVPERQSDTYVPPINPGTSFSGSGSSGQGVRNPNNAQTVGQNPNNGQFGGQNPSNAQFGGQSPNNGQFGGQSPSNGQFGGQSPSNGQFGGQSPSNGQFGGQNPNNAQFGGQSPTNIPRRRQNPNGAQTDQRGRPGNVPPPPIREPNREAAPGPAYRPQNTRGTPNRKVSPDSNLFAGIVNDFAFRMVEELNLQSNFVISPLSIFVALAMCYLASERQTKSQLEQALGLNEYSVHGQSLHKGIRDLLDLVSSEKQGDLLLVANGMFLGRNFTVDARFAEEIRRYYSAELKNVDFGNSDLSMAVINDWVARSTRNAIPNLIDMPPPAITRLLLMNAVYFKSAWKTQFPTDLTYNGRFHTRSGVSKEVPTMVLLDETFPLYRSDDQRHSFIKLPYDGDRVSMVIALPYTETERPMPSVRDQTLCHIMDAMKEVKLDSVTLPKFKLEEVLSLRRPLLQLGVRDIFNLQAVNLSNMRRQNDVYVSAILHKAVVEVDEQGTTAAAVTGVRFVPLSIRNTSDFLVDHPFAFYIIHEPSGLVLFYGKVYDIGENPRTETAPIRPRPYSDAPSNHQEAYRNPNPSGRVRIHGAVTFEDDK